jgi:phosphatidylglycerol:prolipoprotein diacylglycerol transferase
MFPELGSIGPFTFYSFGLMFALGLVAAGWLMHHDVRERGLRPGLAVELILAAAVGGFVGARVYYVLDTGDTDSGFLGGSGLTWYGGLIGGAALVLAVGRIRRVPLGLVANLAAPAVALGYGIGRLGCQLAGDGDYGSASDLPWAMSYPDGTVPTTRLVHPAPLYESTALLAIFWVLWRLRGRMPPWSLCGLYLVLAGVMRFLVEFVRRNPEELAGLTVAQVISLAAVVVGGALLALTLRRPAAPAPA